MISAPKLISQGQMVLKIKLITFLLKKFTTAKFYNLTPLTLKWIKMSIKWWKLLLTGLEKKERMLQMKKLVQLRPIIILSSILKMNRQSLTKILEGVIQKIQIEFSQLDLGMGGRKERKKIRLSTEIKLIIEINSSRKNPKWIWINPIKLWKIEMIIT